MNAIESNEKVRGGVLCIAGRIPVADLFTKLANGLSLNEIAKQTDWPRHAMSAALHELADIYSQPPGPTIYTCPFCDEESRGRPGALFHHATCEKVPGRSEPNPSIEAAAKEIYETITVRYFANTAVQKEIIDCLHRHFGQASRAERAWEIYQEHRHEWTLFEGCDGHWKVMQSGSMKLLESADNPITAILAAGGEEGEDDGRCVDSTS